MGAGGKTWRPGAGAGFEESRRFSAEARSVRAARRFAAGRVSSPERRNVVALIVSELATNAVIHAGTGFEVRISEDTDGCVRGSVTDTGGGFPNVERQLPPLGERGRGLRIVERLATAWGTERLTDGKRVWFEL